MLHIFNQSACVERRKMIHFMGKTHNKIGNAKLLYPCCFGIRYRAKPNNSEFRIPKYRTDQ